MNKVLPVVATFGTWMILVAPTAKSDVIHPSSIWINQTTAGTTIIPSGASAGSLIPAIGSELSFNLPFGGTNTVLGFANAATAGSPWTVSPASLGSATLQNGILPPNPASSGTILDFTGTITTTANQTLALSHDDGIILKIDNVTVLSGVPNGTQTYNGEGAGTHTFDLFYGECCGLPATLVFTKGGVAVTNTPVSSAPEPAALTLLGGALVGLVLLRGCRRHNRLTPV
jgi:hypothetical protein